MSKAKVQRSTVEPSPRCRMVMTRPVGSRVTVSKSAEPTRTKEKPKKSEEAACDVSADGSSSSDSSCSRSSLKTDDLLSKRRRNRVRLVKAVSERVETAELVLTKRRCGWITPNSDPFYVSYHDEEWGIPVHDDKKLFELLSLSMALAELSWLTILNKRDSFRELFNSFDPASIAKFSEKKIIAVASSGNCLLSDVKLRAVVENARQILKIVEEYGSFSCYCWTFVSHKPIVNGFRYPRQVPVKTPKAEAISKNLMRRGFHCVGPTVVYAFMQAAGIVNDHLCSCFRHKECNIITAITTNHVSRRLTIV